MPFPDTFDLADLDGITITAESRPERINLKIGLICTLFIRDPHNPTVRRALALCGDEYQDLFGNHLRLYLQPNGRGKFKRYPKGGMPLADYVEQRDSPEIQFGPSFTGAPTMFDASLYSLDILASGKDWFPKGDKPAFFSATIPVGFLLEHQNEAVFQRLVHDWCKVLKPQSGYAGLGIIQSVDWWQKKTTVCQAYAIGRRFPGLEIDNPSVISLYIGEGIKGVNWLTALSDDCLKPIGGRKVLLERLDENFHVFEYERGILIQAGAAPQLGDVNRQHIPRYYSHLAQLLKPLRMRFPAQSSIFTPCNGRSTAEITEEWLARLDHFTPTYRDENGV